MRSLTCVDRLTYHKPSCEQAVATDRAQNVREVRVQRWSKHAILSDHDTAPVAPAVVMETGGTSCEVVLELPQIYHGPLRLPSLLLCASTHQSAVQLTEKHVMRQIAGYLHVLSIVSCSFHGAAHSTLYVTGEQQVQSFVAIPAGWNVFLPNFGLPKLSHRAPLDREASNVQPSFYGRVVMEPGSTNETRSLACGELAATPQVESLALLVERGLCTFRHKATNAFNAGYKALLVSNTILGLAKVPDMTAGSEVDDRAVEIPAWSIDLSDGQALRNWILADARLVIQVSDSPRRPNLGPFQEDVFGLRQVFSK
ncbi:unnamed protein product [Symbiodinium sp. CCMP2592]|nr:unnamed protein product [Symbiodinium sp. CCMP2592]